MATTGRKFLKLSQAQGLTVSRHALDRMRQYTGLDLHENLAMLLFRHSEYRSPEQVLMLGFRPRYWGRKAEGQKSWYFRFHVSGEELLAVVAEGDRPGEYVWVTTYGVNDQTRHYRLVDTEAVAA